MTRTYNQIWERLDEKNGKSSKLIDVVVHDTTRLKNCA